ncbi:MAG: NAD(P)-dependent oxidoreductase [Chthoniobacteraceae bacterium]
MTTKSRERIGLVGLGLMGSALAERFVGGGFRVVGWDIVPARRKALKRIGGEPARDAGEVLTACERIVFSLPGYDDSAALLGAAGWRRGRIVLDTSTGDPRKAAAIGKRVRGYLDATISGNSDQVRSREVSVLAGGTKAAFVRCADLFACFTDKTIHTGPCGSGAMMKLITNLVLGLNRAVLAEGLAFAEHVGVAPLRALDALKTSPAYSRAMDVKGAKMVRRDFTPQARLAQHLRDVRLIVELARRTHAKVPFSSVHRRLLAGLAAAGFGDEDNSAILRAFGDEC